MTKLSEWISEYCEENGIELPEDIPDEKTALQFLSVIGSKDGGDYGVIPAGSITFIYEQPHLPNYDAFDIDFPIVDSDSNSATIAPCTIAPEGTTNEWALITYKGRVEFVTQDDGVYLPLNVWGENVIEIEEDGEPRFFISGAGTVHISAVLE